MTGTSGAFVTSYTYDANGNRTGAGTDTFQYDWRNRMTQATVGGASVSYTYAGDDLRATRTQGTMVTPYLWDRESGLPELVDDGTQITVQLGGGELATVDRSTNAATYPLADALGSARTRTDGAGAVTGTSEWDPWGNVRASSGTQGSFGWTGELKDASTNLVYLRARDYSPGTGRFTSRDTVRPNGPATQGSNAYHYTANNPTTRIDPTGHNPEFAADLMGAAYVYNADKPIPHHLQATSSVLDRLLLPEIQLHSTCSWRPGEHIGSHLQRCLAIGEWGGRVPGLLTAIPAPSNSYPGLTGATNRASTERAPFQTR